MSQASSNFIRIGLPETGKQVYACGPVAIKYKALESASQKGNYWATTVMKELQRLTSGKLGHDHVYVKKQVFPGGVETFYLKLPGFNATVKELHSAYFIMQMDVSLDYFLLQDQYEKPGLHFVHKENKEWVVRLLKDEKIEINKRSINTKHGLVNPQSENAVDYVIANVAAPCRTPEKAAKLAAAHIKASPYKESKIDSLGFNMLYTPGAMTIGGCYNLKEARNAETSENLLETSYLLADAMINAEKANMQVAWISHGGGSGYLTQAMRIVRDKGHSLKSQTIFLSRPTTNPGSAYTLSQDLGMTLNQKYVSSKHDVLMELAAADLTLGIGTSLNRLKNEDVYGLFNFGSDCWNTIGGWKNLIKIGAAFGGAAAACFAGVSVVVAAVGAGAGVTIPTLIANMNSVSEWPDTESAVEEISKPLLEKMTSFFKRQQ